MAENYGSMSSAELNDIIEDGRLEVRALMYGDGGELRDRSEADDRRLAELVDQVETARRHLAIRGSRSNESSFPREKAATRGRRTARITGGILDSDPEEALRLGEDQVRSLALRAVDRAEGLSAQQGDRLDGYVRATATPDEPYFDGAAFSRRLLLTESEAYRSAFAQVMQDPHPILTAEEAAAIRAERRLAAEEYRVMGEGSGAVGAFGLPILIDPSIMLESGAGAVPIMEICRVVPTNTNVWKGVSSAPPTFSWDTAGTAVSDDSVTLSQPSITIYTTRGFIPAHLELMMDYPSFQTEFQSLLAQGYMDIMAATTATGTGTAQPFGVFTKLDATAGSEVLLTTNSAAGGFIASEIFKIWNSVPERFRPRSTWLMSVSVESQIRSFATTTAGQATSYFTTDLTAGGLSRLNGRPVVITDYAPSYLSTNTHRNFLIVGDFQNYVVAQRIGLRVEPIQMLFDTTSGLPTGVRGLFAYGRAGADVSVTNGLRILNQT